ncbi:MAG TPA: MFS transporter [Thermomicrobiales bacterium]|nr:MFS transporter [Thermomicrobiales bacterium]HRA31514.1 MFS transporter [Thermomicrobiales bacterium]
MQPTFSDAETPSADNSDKPVPYRTILRRRNVRLLAGSRFTSRMAQTTLSYGAMVHLGQAGASQLGVSLVGSVSYIAPLFFGVQGGAAADTMSKRVALAFGFGMQALLCLLSAVFLTTTVGSLMFLMFMTSLLMVIVIPSMKAAVAIVSTPSEMASVNAVIALVGSVGSALGSTMIAPVLISVSGIDMVLYVAAVLFAVGAIRVFKMDVEHGKPEPGAWRKIDWKPRSISLRMNADWIRDHRSVGTMILTGAIVVALFEAFTTLIPIYVRDVLNANPAHSVYIFAPAGVGFLVATVVAPWVIMRFGERRLAVVALGCVTTGMILFGLIRPIAPFVSIISPLRLLEPFGVHLSKEVLAASVIALPTNFGSTAAGAAVDNFVNRHTPADRQGATFGLKEVQENALALATIIALGVVSNLVGPRIVMIVAPIIVLLPVIWLLRYSFKREDQPMMTRREAFALLTSGEESLPADT